MLPVSVAIAVLAALATPAAAIRASRPEDIAWRNEVLEQARVQLANVNLAAVNATGEYAPYQVDCPANTTWVRQASSGLSDGEKQYLDKRGSAIDEAVKAMTSRHGLDNPARRPVIAVALSGGGYRSMLYGLGATSALLNSTGDAANGTAGWLDAVSYMAGLSGGAWGTGAFAANGGKSPIDLQKDVWELDVNFIMPEKNNTDFYNELFTEAEAKAAAGFPVQVTDVYGLALGERLFPLEYRLDTTPNLTISGLMTAVPEYESASLPLPIITALGLTGPDQNASDSQVYFEFTPFEFGTWSVSPNASSPSGYFTPIEYLGSGVSSGNSNGTCYKGFDQLSFVMGVSSTLFNSLPFSIASIFPASPDQMAVFNNETEDVATFPNPFTEQEGTVSTLADGSHLTLVDGGEAGRNLPMSSLMVEDRHIDAIITFDASGNTDYSWPDGSSLHNEYQAAVASAEAANTPVRFPPVPSRNGFINGGYNTRPTFFGCDNTSAPLVVYIPNYPWTTMSNVSTFSFSFPNDTDAGLLHNGLNAVTLNGTVDAWPTCLTCALTDRAGGYTAENRSEACTSCFNAFCWDGTDNDTAPAANQYQPAVGAPQFVQQLNITLPTAPAGDGGGNSSAASGYPAASMWLAVAAAAVGLAATF